jgi:RHS repeat-associated protein
VASLSVFGPTGFRDVFTLPTTGMYTFVVDPRVQQTGSVTFLLAAVADNTGTTEVGTPTTVVTTTIGENATRTFTGTAGQKLVFHVSGNTFSEGVDLAVRPPGGGSAVASLSVFGPTGFRDVFSLPTTGTYTFEVDPRVQQTGSVTFLLAAVADNTGTTQIGTPTDIVTTTIGENATRTFTGTAGQRLTLAVSGNTFSDGVDLTVRPPGGGSAVASLSVFGPTGFRDPFTLPSTGTYTVTIDPRLQQLGSLTFLLANAPAGLTAAAEPESDATVRAASASSEPAEDTAIAAAAIAPLTITVAELLANDRPGPANESAQTLTVTAVTAGPFTHGTVTFAAGVVVYQPDEDFVGNATIPYTICDDGTTNGRADPLCSTGAISVKVTANHPPVVDPQAVTTAEDTPVSLTLTGRDPDGEPINFVVADGPDRGALSGAAPALTYTPAPDANGGDAFTYRANDGKDQSLPASVTITVTEVNDPPAPQADVVTARAGQQVTVAAATLAANDDAGPFDERFQVLNVTAVAAGPETHGTVTLAGGTVTFVPDDGFSGTAVIGYTVCDNGTTDGAADPSCADSTLSIVANLPPVAVDQSAQTSLTRPVAIVLNATDPDGDALSYAIVTPPEHGTLTGTAPNVTYTAAAGFAGADSFTFTASDAHGVSAPATVSITVNDVPPPTLGPDTATVRPGQSVPVDVLANDTPGSGTIDPATLAVTAAPAKGTAVVESGKVRYRAQETTSGPDTFSYTVCDTGGGCATAIVTVAITENGPPVASNDSFDVAAGGTLRPAAPGVLANDNDPDTGETLQARLVRGVTNGTLLLLSSGAFTYVPNGPGVDTFVYHVVDSGGAMSNEATVTIYVTGPAGPPIVGNDLFQVQQGGELAVAAPGLLTNDTSPNPRLSLTVQLRRDAAKGTLVLQPDGSFVYTPLPGYTGIDQFSYTLRDSEGRMSAEARVGITVTAGGPATATVGETSPAAGAIVLGPTHFTATLVPPPGETVTEWTVSYRRPGSSILVPLNSGTGPAVAAEFDATLVRNGTYSIVTRAVTSGGGVLVNETGVSVEGDYKPGRYTTTYRDVALNSANIPIELFRTYDSTNKAAGELGAGWSLELANFRVDANGPLGAGGWSKVTCGSFPFLGTCYESSKPHFVTVTWPDGHVERFRFAPNQGSQLVPNITTAGFAAEPGTTSTLEPIGNGLLLSGSDFLLGDFFSADGIYDPIGFVLTDRFGTRYRLDRRAGLLGITDRNGNTVSLGSGGVESSSGLGMTFVRDAENRITAITGPRGSIDYTYDDAGDLVRVDYPNGTSQTFTYDGEHNLLTVSGGGELVRTVHYNDDGRVRAITDGNGRTTTIDSDVAGHQQVSTDRTGRLTTVSTYNDRGNLIHQDQTFDGRTVTTAATYDDVGRQLSASDGNGHTRRWTYDNAGNVLTETDGNENTTTSTYNDFGQVLTIIDPTSRMTTYTYDPHGNRLTEVEPGGATTTHVYDDDGLLISTTDPLLRTTTFTNDAAGHPTSATDAAGRTTRQVVDPATGWMTSVTDPNESTTTLGYDANGNLTSITDDNDHTQTIEYDDFGRLGVITDPLGETFRRTYDPAGNLVEVTDRDGRDITFDYDNEGRLTSKSVPGAGTSTYTYDPLGRLVTANNAAALLSFTYDDAGNLLTATSSGPPASPQPEVTLTYTYDDANRRTSVTGPGGTVAYGFDDANRLTSVTDAAGGDFIYGYNTRGLLATISRPNGVDDTRTYDAAGQLTALSSRLDGTVVGEAGYTYDLAGRRTSLTTPAGTASFGYDPGSQLTSASYPAAAGIPAQSFEYDAVGNRTSTETAPEGSYLHDAANRLVSDATSDFTYDDEGNTTSRTVRATGATTSYGWSAEHQLMSITYPDATSTTFDYDALGRRVAINDPGTTSRLVYDGESVAATYDGAGDLTASFTDDGASATSHLEMVQDGERTFFLVDALGSTTSLTRLDGAIATSYTYEAFGAATRTGSLANPFTFTGQFDHGRSGLVLFPERVYDPTLGRFLSQDPVFSVNPYPYVKNNPANMLDPTGATVGGVIRGGIACVALVLGAWNANPAGNQGIQKAAECTKEILDAIAKRKELEAAQKAVQAQLVAEK